MRGRRRGRSGWGREEGRKTEEEYEEREEGLS